MTVLPEGVTAHTLIALEFVTGESIVAPGIVTSASQSAEYNRLLNMFIESTRSGGRALEIGSRARSGNTYRHLVDPITEYIGMDIKAGPNVDVVGDAHHLSRHVEGKFDFIFSISVFEHLLMPWMVALEMNKVMNEGGYAYIQSHGAWPLHEEPWDFWRFSKDAWDGIFNLHTGFEMVAKDQALKCIMTSALAAGGPTETLDQAHSYLLSACLVRKIGAPQVEWGAEASDVYDLNYAHE